MKKGRYIYIQYSLDKSRATALSPPRRSDVASFPLFSPTYLSDNRDQQAAMARTNGDPARFFPKRDVIRPIVSTYQT